MLVVDDQATDRELMTTVLGYAGYEVWEAATGLEALNIVRAKPPDLIIADILMPAMDGYELVRELRGQRASAHIPVVFCTATYGSSEVRRLAEACGVSHILVKPCEPTDIMQIAATALQEEERHIPPPLPSDTFQREHLRLVNAKLVQKVAELEESRRQTAESLTLLETLQATAPVGIGFVDREFRLVRCNDTLAAMTGGPPDEQVGRTVAEVMPERWPRLEPIYRRVVDTGEAVVNQEMSGPSSSSVGDDRSLLASYYPVQLHEEVIGIGMVVVDITERRQADEFRSVVMDTMAEGLAVTDSEGRVTFMNAAASRMLGWTTDELLGRSARAVIHGRQLDDSPSVAEDWEIRRVQTAGESITVASDVFVRKDGSRLPVAYSAAPLAGGADTYGAVVVFRDITEEQNERMRLQRELDAITWIGRTRDALDEGRLVLYSQPIVSLKDGDPSEELLLRMIGRDGGVIPPGRFLPSAEKFGLIADIDDWVVTQAIGLAARGRRVEANLSGESVGNAELLAVVERELRQTGADPANIVFEITETALMRDIGAGRAFTERLVELGCEIALDDFGTGFGSFTYLKTLPLTYLKIDIEFVRHLGSNPANQHLVKAIVNLAEGFGHQTIAEGVEDEHTLALLRDYSVDFAQGFHLGMPAPIGAGDGRPA
ncbi:MAG: EAL domain-containing protein [Solirubrobacteraceae bacterium]